MAHDAHAQHVKQHYIRLLLMTVASFLVMYALMYAMVDRWANVLGNINQVYMAGVMAMPMALIELALMAQMYRNRHLNVVIIAIAVVAWVICWFGIRQQWGVSDRQFLRSMIPHHAAAVLMCERNALRDPKVQDLCKRILDSQRAEIEEMQMALSAGQ
jgi:uncharacterized protein (DUF305 family)